MRTFDVPFLESPLRIDGLLDEPIYQRVEPLTDFVYPWEPERTPPPTRAWLFWDRQYLYACFSVEDSAYRTAPRGPHGKAEVLEHSRAEFFLWNGDADSPYYGFEINPHGVTLDYEARFHRRFNRDWSCKDLQVGSDRTESGYNLEAAIPLDTMAEVGYDLRRHDTWRAGLYRAETEPEDPEAFHWSCIVNPGQPEVDFHIPESFGKMVLRPAK